ncbi:hypothetical protein [Caenispirillum bisanense]|uniref:hypothetical protein n=1 Tax=Caenispirillum bisanense TaxID=414052 RepID=UPI0031D774F2
MIDDISIRPSQKAGLPSKEQYIATFGGFVCLRILSVGAEYAVVTATADEDNKQFLAPDNQALLMGLGRRTAEELGGPHAECCDNYGRKYVQICNIENEEDADRVVKVFTRLLYEHIQAGEKAQADDAVESDARRELREIYDAIAPADSGEDAYLGDGVWISRDGGWCDRGR